MVEETTQDTRIANGLSRLTGARSGVKGKGNGDPYTRILFCAHWQRHRRSGHL